MPSTPTRLFRELTEQESDFFFSIKGNEKPLQRQVSRQFEGKHQIPFTATHHKIGHGGEITWVLRAKEAPEHIKADWPGGAWIVELVTSGSRDGNPFTARHLFIISLCSTTEALLRLIRERWSNESWHWIPNTQLHEDKHHYRSNRAGVLGSIRPLLSQRRQRCCQLAGRLRFSGTDRFHWSQQTVWLSSRPVTIQPSRIK